MYIINLLQKINILKLLNKKINKKIVSFCDTLNYVNIFLFYLKFNLL
jgi:hypothetical protein